MRARHVIIPGLGLSLATAAFLFACGGSETQPTPTPDAGSDATLDATKDQAAEAAPPEAGCADGSINDLNPPDAAIGDSGATLPGCATCLKTKCSSDISDCDKLCECKEAVIGTYDCLGKGKGFQTCATQNFIGAGQDTQAIGLSLGQCANANCKQECGLASFNFDAGSDSGIKDASGQ